MSTAQVIQNNYCMKKMLATFYLKFCVFIYFLKPNFYPQESVVISNKIGAMLTISMNISSQLYSFLIGKVF
jgi:hypothetical protein